MENILFKVNFNFLLNFSITDINLLLFYERMMNKIDSLKSKISILSIVLIKYWLSVNRKMKSIFFSCETELLEKFLQFMNFLWKTSLWRLFFFQISLKMVNGNMSVRNIYTEKGRMHEIYIHKFARNFF